MRILLVGAGGVGGAFAAIAARRDFFEQIVIADYDGAKADTAAAVDDRFVGARIDASDAAAVTQLCREHGITHVMNAVDPVFNMPLFDGAFAAGADYVDMAMSLSRPHPETPYEKVGVKLGDEQFAKADAWEKDGRLALVGIGVEPGLSDVFARYAADHLFSEIDELGTRDGANLVVTDDDGNEIFAPSFSMWTTIEECLNPPVIYEKAQAMSTGDGSRPRRSPSPRSSTSPRASARSSASTWSTRRCSSCRAGSTASEPRSSTASATSSSPSSRCSTRSASTAPRRSGSRASRSHPVTSSPPCLPDPATIGPRMKGKTCAGLWVTGKDKDGAPRSTYLYHVVDNEWSMQEYGHQCVVWQTAVNPVVALELIAPGDLVGRGRARPGGLRRGSLPRPADRVRQPLGPESSEPWRPRSPSVA